MSKNYETCQVFILRYLDGVVKIVVNFKTLPPMLLCNKYINTRKHHTFQGRIQSLYHAIYFLQRMDLILVIWLHLRILSIKAPLFAFLFSQKLHFLSFYKSRSLWISSQTVRIWHYYRRFVFLAVSQEVSRPINWPQNWIDFG